MKQIVSALVLVACFAHPSSGIAQDKQGEDGQSLISRGFQMMMEGVFKEAEPALDELQNLADNFEPWMREFAENAGPALRGLMEEIGDLSQYEAPERLPNGDIILRRKTPDMPETPWGDETGTNDQGAIDL